jgi:lysophospholipase L1-like esterase
MKKTAIILIRIIIILIFSLAILELLARFFLPPIGLNLRGLYEVNNNKNDLPYDFKPNASLIVNGVVYKINNQRFRAEKEYKKEKPKDTVRIAIIGDSVGFGYGLPIESTLNSQLEKQLKQKTKKNIEVLNFAVPGYGIESNINIIDKKVKQFSPDIVIYVMCINDLTDNETIDSQGNNLAFKGRRLETWVFTHSRLYSFIRSAWDYNKTVEENKAQLGRTGVVTNSALDGFQTFIISSFGTKEEYAKQYHQKLENKLTLYAQKAKEDKFTPIILVAPLEIQLRKNFDPQPQDETCKIAKSDNILCYNPLEKFKKEFDKQHKKLFLDFVHLDANGTAVLSSGINQFIENQKILK